jgi:hypothetical protein
VQMSSGAALRDVKTEPLRGEFASLMVQRRRGSNAASMDAPIKLFREEFVLRMVQQRSGAAMRGVPMELSREECVGLMAQMQHW